MAEFLTAEEAVAKYIPDGVTIAADGFAPCGGPEELLAAIRKRFDASGHPRGLTIFGTSYGNARGRGMDHLACDGLVRKAVAGYFAMNRNMGRLILEGKIEGYLYPLGIISQLYREMAARRPGVITHIGLGTFIDPRVEGCALNGISKDQLIEVVNLDGREWLFYKPVPLDVGLIRGTTADEHGNITMEREVGFYNVTALAQAVKNNGGRVIVQVERLAAAGSLNPKSVKVPGVLVDAVVVASPENHLQTWREPYNPYYACETRAPASSFAARRIPLDVRKIIARRALMELTPGMVVNLGVGMPELVGSVAFEEGVADMFTLTVEAGPIGGVPAYGLSFGAATNAEAIIDMPYQFDYYDGGGLDITIVGLGQVDREGNVNVSKLGSRLPGVGGFLSVTQPTKKVVFAGTFTGVDGPEVSVTDGRLTVVKEGQAIKFANHLYQRTFGAGYALQKGQSVLYVTERAVFRLGGDGLELAEIAPGIDPERDVLSRMEFKPAIATDLKLMDPRVFREESMNVAADMKRGTF